MAKETILKRDVGQEAKKEQKAGIETSVGGIQKGKQVSVYASKELAEQADILFGTRPECVMAALSTVKKAEFSVEEAKELVRKFLKREVR